MTKLYISGAAGSGKTTYAKKLSQKLGIKCFDLDDVKWINSGKSGTFNTERSKEERAEALKNILTQNESWICEGVYFQDWILPVVERADEVIILNPPVYLRQYRIIKRSLKRILNIEESKFKETPKALFKLLSWNQHYNKKYLPRLMDKIHNTETKYKIVRKIR